MAMQVRGPECVSTCQRGARRVVRRCHGQRGIDFTIHYAIDSGRLGAKQGATAMPAQSTWLGRLKMPIDVGLKALRPADGYIADAPGKLTGRSLQAFTGHAWRGGVPTRHWSRAVDRQAVSAGEAT